jgi:SPP1 family predicted phage head-tail adaptor
MRAGALDRRITLERATTTANALNEPVATWGPLCVVAAAVKPVTNAERVAAAQVQAEVMTRFQIRYNALTSTVDARDRLVFAGKVYDIVGVMELGRREGIEISARASGELG